MRSRKTKNLAREVIIHIPAVLAGYLLALIAINLHDAHKFNQRQDDAVYTTDDRGDDAELNRDIFNPNSFEQVQWQYNTNQRVGEIFGKTAAKEYAMDMDSLMSGTATAKQMFGSERQARDYCTEAVIRAYKDATSRIRFRRGNVAAIPFPNQRCVESKAFKKAMRNARHLVKYFEQDSVPNSIIKKPSEQDFQSISAGSLVRKGRHAYMYMGIGYIDKDGRTFVENPRGRPVIASNDNKEIFEYFDFARCTVVDVPKIVQHKLQHDVQRHVR